MFFAHGTRAPGEQTGEVPASDGCFFSGSGRDACVSVIVLFVCGIAWCWEREAVGASTASGQFGFKGSKNNGGHDLDVQILPNESSHGKGSLVSLPISIPQPSKQWTLERTQLNEITPSSKAQIS